jgi:hypothetical protein
MAERVGRDISRSCGQWEAVVPWETTAPIDFVSAGSDARPCRPSVLAVVSPWILCSPFIIARQASFMGN